MKIPASVLQKSVLESVDVVFVSPFCGIKTGVGFVVYGNNGINHDVFGKYELSLWTMLFKSKGFSKSKCAYISVA